MNVTVTLFHGLMGWAIGLLALFAVAGFLTEGWGWLAARYTPTGRWGGVHITRRWDRPGARVGMKDGRQARICVVLRDYDAGPIAVVQPCRSEGEWEQPEWALLGDLRPAGHALATAAQEDA